MRILVVSNLYPPHFIGGYELGCQDLVIHLMEKGHEVAVLTSTYCVPGKVCEGNVHRLLSIDFSRRLSFWKAIKKESSNQHHFRHLCKTFCPDVVFFWNMANISVSLVFIAQDLCLPTSFYVFDNWLATWEMDHWHQILARLPPWLNTVLRSCLSAKVITVLPEDHIDLTHSMFASHYLLRVASNAGKDTINSRVVPWGVRECSDYHEKPDDSGLLRILYVGQIVALKGVHTVIEAVGLLFAACPGYRLKLTIVGDHQFDLAYTDHLHKMIDDYGIHELVTFTGKVAHACVEEYYRANNIFVFSSIWDEPFGITQLEAMSYGLVVLGTVVGGSGDVLKSGVNGLIFERANALACAREIRRLAEDRSLYERLREGALNSVRKRFKFSRLVGDVEHILGEAANSSYGIEKSFVTGGAPASKCCAVYRSIPLKRVLVTCFHKLLAVLILLVVNFFRSKVSEAPGALATDQLRENLLLVSLGEDSDLALLLPYLHRLRSNPAVGRISLVVRKEFVAIMADCPHLDEVIPFNLTSVKDWQEMSRGHIVWWFRAFAMKRQLVKGAGPNTAVLLCWASDAVQAAAAAIMHASGTAVRLLGPVSSGNGFKIRLLDHFIVEGGFKSGGSSDMSVLAEIFKFQGECWHHNEQWHTMAKDVARRQLVEKLGESRHRPIVALAPGGMYESRCWPIERYAQLGRWLQEAWSAVVIILGNDDDVPRCTELAHHLEAASTHVMASTSNLMSWLPVIAGVDLFCGNDNLFFYMTLQSQTPRIGLFGPGRLNRVKAHYLEQDIVRITIPCSPCHDECMYTEPICMTGLDVREVKSRVLAKLTGLLQVEKT